MMPEKKLPIRHQKTKQTNRKTNTHHTSKTSRTNIRISKLSDTIFRTEESHIFTIK